MRHSLKELIGLMPPLDGQRHTKVDWAAVEQHMGLTYPSTFKDFVSVYGSSHWFDKLLPFYCVGSSKKEMTDFTDSIARKLSSFRDNMYTNDFDPMELPLYPDAGGLLPFMADIDGAEYCWLTKSSDPDKWPIYCWRMGRITILQRATICSMFTGFLKRESNMVKLWGDVDTYDAERIRIDDVSAD